MPHALTSRSDKDSRPLFFRPFLPLKGDEWDMNGETREGHRVKHQHGTMDDDIFHAPIKMAPLLSTTSSRFLHDGAFTTCHFSLSVSAILR